MKKLFFFIFVPFAFLGACSDGDMPAINGMWQLKSIEDANRTIQPIDTIFYAFQRQSIFSYTLLQEQENRPATSIVIYGFIDFPAHDRLHIQLDKDAKYYKNALLPWNWGEKSPENDVIYDIVKLNSKNLILFHDKKTYYFVKY
jgi:hypothetical protein